MTGYWRFQGRLDGVVDGDTLDVVCDLGFRTERQVRVRLDGVDTAEIYGVDAESEEFHDGAVHKKYVEDWLAKADRQGVDYPLTIHTKQETGKYGRYIAIIESPEHDLTLNESLVEQFPEVESNYE